MKKLYGMQPVGKESKRQHQVEEENKQLDEAAKKKQKRQLEEKNRFEHRTGTLCNMRGSYARSNFLTLHGSTIT